MKETFRMSMGGAGGWLVPLVVVLLAAGCAGNHPAGASGPGAVPSRGTVPADGTRGLAARYLAIAEPANHRLDHEVDGYRDREHTDLAAAESDLRAEAATERQFDRPLSMIPFPPRIAAIARALIQANQRRIGLTSRQARSSSITSLLRFDRRHRAADVAVEIQVKAIRKALGLPPPETS